MMTSTIDPHRGEHAQRSRERKVLTIKGVLFILGAGCGAYIGFTVARDGFDFSGSWPPEVAIGMALLYVAAILLGGWLLDGAIDEVEKFNQYRAVAVAGLVYMLAYPVWFLLWKADLLVEPIHWVLFLAFWASLAGASLWYRFR